MGAVYRRAPLRSVDTHCCALFPRNDRGVGPCLQAGPQPVTAWGPEVMCSPRRFVKWKQNLVPSPSLGPQPSTLPAPEQACGFAVFIWGSFCSTVQCSPLPRPHVRCLAGPPFTVLASDSPRPVARARGGRRHCARLCSSRTQLRCSSRSGGRSCVCAHTCACVHVCACDTHSTQDQGPWARGRQSWGRLARGQRP